VEENCKAKSSGVPALLEQADELSLAEQKILLQGLFDKFWQRRIDVSLRSKVAFKEWKPGIIDTFLAKKISDPQMELEYAYQTVQTNLIQLRQAVAASISCSKYTDARIEKNLESKEALNQSLTNEGEILSEEEKEKIRSDINRCDEVLKSAEKEKIQNKEAEKISRQFLRDAEDICSMIYASKQSLIARFRAALAFQRVKEIWTQKCNTDMSSELSKFEKLVKEEELRSKLYTEEFISEKDLIKRSMAIIEYATWVFERVEELLKKLDSSDDQN
jgi:phage shock protein A